MLTFLILYICGVNKQSFSFDTGAYTGSSQVGGQNSTPATKNLCFNEFASIFYASLSCPSLRAPGGGGIAHPPLELTPALIDISYPSTEHYQPTVYSQCVLYLINKEIFHCIREIIKKKSRFIQNISTHI